MRRHIPNLFTFGNLFCGTLAAMLAVQGDFDIAAGLVALGVFLDFFDGFFARLLGVQGELGKQLDSLADVVTSGVAPGLLMFHFYNEVIGTSNLEPTDSIVILSYTAFLLTLGAAYRLAKFNIDTRQSDSFIGVPTPAMSLFVVSLPVIYEYGEVEAVNIVLENAYVLAGVSVAFTILMNAELPLLSLKFKSFGLKKNIYKYLLMLVSVVLLLVLKFIAVPLIILFYIVLSIISYLTTQKD
jgi:CDP-diacylglycerol--serine O-phosphatidyltransferase